MVFQSYALFPHMNVIHNVGYGLSVTGVGKDEAARRAKAAMDSVGLAGYEPAPAQRAERWPAAARGGGAQRWCWSPA
jgi:iron(III) transport system ATP-binding protein